MEFVTGKQALSILNITTRQGLHKIVKSNNITVKNQGAGKPNLYLKADLENYLQNNKNNIDKFKNETTRKKSETRKKAIEIRIEKSIELQESKPKELEYKEENLNQQNKDFTPLNEIGQNEYLRVEQLLIDMGIFKEADRSLLLLYSISYQKYINAVTKSAGEDDITIDDTGNIKVHPYFQVADKCFNHMTKLADKLGIGERSRIGLEIKKAKKETLLDILDKDEF